MLTYGVLRFFVEFLRDTPKDWVTLSHGQWFSLAAIIISAGIFVRKGVLQRGNI